MCFDVLDPDYLDLAFDMIGELARKRPSPITQGRPEIWAGGVLHLLGQLNFLWYADSIPHITAKDLAVFVGASPASLNAKANVIRDALGVRELDPRYMLPSA